METATFTKTFNDITVAKTVSEAIDILNNTSFDIIFLDRNGIELAEKLFNRTVNGFGTPIIIYSINITEVNRILRFVPYAKAYPITTIAHDLAKYANIVYEEACRHMNGNKDQQSNPDQTKSRTG